MEQKHCWGNKNKTNMLSSEGPFFSFFEKLQRNVYVIAEILANIYI